MKIDKNHSLQRKFRAKVARTSITNRRRRSRERENRSTRPRWRSGEEPPSEPEDPGRGGPPKGGTRTVRTAGRREKKSLGRTSTSKLTDLKTIHPCREARGWEGMKKQRGGTSRGTLTKRRMLKSSFHSQASVPYKRDSRLKKRRLETSRHCHRPRGRENRSTRRRFRAAGAVG